MDAFKETVYYTNDNAPNKLRDALPLECLSGEYPVALLCRVYDPTDSDCLNDPNFFNDLEVIQHFCGKYEDICISFDLFVNACPLQIYCVYVLTLFTVV